MESPVGQMPVPLILQRMEKRRARRLCLCRERIDIEQGVEPAPLAMKLRA